MKKITASVALAISIAIVFVVTTLTFSAKAEALFDGLTDQEQVAVHVAVANLACNVAVTDDEFGVLVHLAASSAGKEVSDRLAETYGVIAGLYAKRLIVEGVRDIYCEVVASKVPALLGR